MSGNDDFSAALGRMCSASLKLSASTQYLEEVRQHLSRCGTYSRIGLPRSYGNLQSYWTTTKLWNITVVLDCYEAMETYSRIGILRSYGNLQSYWTTTKLWKLTVVFFRLPQINPATRTLILTGYPNVGKSSFMNILTDANVDVQPYAFTTKTVFVGE